MRVALSSPAVREILREFDGRGDRELRRGEEGWCITRGHDTTPMFDWSTASHRAFFPAWRLLPGGGGIRQEARSDGSFEVRATRCDPPR